MNIIIINKPEIEPRKSSEKEFREGDEKDIIPISIIIIIIIIIIINK
jgi:hypothetical protein